MGNMSLIQLLCNKTMVTMIKKLTKMTFKNKLERKLKVMLKMHFLFMIKSLINLCSQFRLRSTNLLKTCRINRNDWKR